MSFRTKLLLVVLLTIFASVSVVAYAVTYYTRAAFEEMDSQRTKALGAQLKKEFKQSGSGLAHRVNNIAGQHIDQNFLASLVLPAGRRALIYTNLDPGFVAASLLGEKIDADQKERFAPLVEQLQKQPQPLVRTIEWTRDPADAETFHAIPLLGRNNQLLCIFFVGSSRGESGQ